MANRRQVTDINMYRNQRRRSKNVRWILIPVFLVACLFAGYFFAISGFFSVDNIIIVGNTNVADEDIINIAEIEKGIWDIYHSWIDAHISDYNTDFYYQSRDYIAACYKAGEII